MENNETKNRYVFEIVLMLISWNSRFHECLNNNNIIMGSNLLFEVKIKLLYFGIGYYITKSKLINEALHLIILYIYYCY